MDPYASLCSNGIKMRYVAIKLLNCGMNQFTLRRGNFKIFLEIVHITMITFLSVMTMSGL